MPIKGLSTRADTRARFKVIGKLRKGEKKKANGHFGDDLKDYFRFTSDDPDIVKTFYEIYDDKPNHIAVYLPFEHMEDSFSSWRELYGQNGLVKRRCDGEYWVNWIDGARYMRGHELCTLGCKDTPNRCPDCPLKAVGRLSVILEPMWRAGYIGLITMETHGINDIGLLSGKLVQHEPLTGKEFTLYRQTNQIGAPIKGKGNAKGKRIAIQKSLVYIELSQRWLLKELEAAENTAWARLEPGRPALPANAEAAGIDFSAVAGLEKPDEPIYVEPEEVEGVVVEEEDRAPARNAAEKATAPPATEPEPETPTAPYVRVPYTGLTDAALLKDAVKVMPFKSIGEVKTVLLQVLGSGWRKETPEAAWATLDDHCASAIIQGEMPVEGEAE